MYSKQDLIMHFSVDAIYNVRTNAGSLEGSPPVEHTLKRTEEMAKKYSYGEPVVIVPPEIKTIPAAPGWKETKILPQWTHIAVYTGPAVKDQDAHGSILCIVWFDSNPQSPLADKDIILQVDWDKHARDFQY